MPDRMAYLNGQFVADSELSISPTDAGFVFGATATEFVRTFRGRLFRLDDHLERLRQSCDLCGIPLSASKDELRAAAERLIAANFSGAELALIVFATPGPLAHLGGAGTGPTLGMHTTPLNVERYRPLFERGARLIVPGIHGSMPIDPRAKVRSRMHWWIADQQARAIDPESWALLLDRDGYVTETAAANFLIVRDGVVISPPRGTILDGVSLRTVEDLCREMGVSFVEQRLSVSDLLTANEAILTGTAFCIAGVSAIEGRQLPWPGQVTQRILSAWSQCVGIDLAGSFLASG